jgi:molybdopterin molybdotransferase
MTMISIEDAYRLVVENLPARGTERIHFQAAQGRVLSEDLHAGMDIPPFDRAAVDGYALHSADVRSVPAVLALAGEVRAGRQAVSALASCQAMTITTGAPVPAGADAVQMIEHTAISPDGRRITILQGIEPGQNIVPRGHEAAAGTTVLEAGRALGPAEIAVLATFGRTEVPVWRRPRVAVLATGDELVEVDREPRNGQIRNSNAYSLTAQLHCLGIEPDYLGIAWDDPADLQLKVSEGFDRDVLIISGGASVGPYDFVKSIFQEMGVEILFDRVSLRPGKPSVFGRRGNTLVFGLPGNPVSSFVSFESFVRPALGRMCGLARPDLERVEGELQRMMRQTPGRTALLPAVVSWEKSGWKMDPLLWKGSGDIIGFSRANALVVFPHDRDSLARGDRVEALLLPDYFMRRR